MIRSPNRDLLVRVATRLEPLLEELVFVGGQVGELLITDPVATRVRPTDDVDAICEVASRPAYFLFGERLKELGFEEDTSQGAPICRWRAGDDLIDVMPTDEEILHFKGNWFRVVIQTPQLYQLTDTLNIRIASAPAFLATKWEAFEDRGEEDWYGSADVADIVTVVAGRPELPDELREADAELRDYVIQSTNSMFAAGVVDDVIAASLPEVSEVPGLLDRVSGGFERLVQLDF